VQADAAIALTQAKTLRCANILLDQHQGVLDHWIQNWLARPSQAELEDLCSWLPLGLHLTQPWRIVLAGAPNVGKSSLCNAILGYQRAITSPIPGTTRDLVTSLTAIDGWPVEIIDTAGLRDDATGIEAEGAALARQSMGGADLVLWLLDPTQHPLLPPVDLGRTHLLVLNKIDLGAETTGCTPDVRVSAHTGAGLDHLLARTASTLVPKVPSAGAAIPFTEEQGAALRAALAATSAGQVEVACAAMRALLARPSAPTPAIPVALAGRTPPLVPRAQF
jgi:tRNA modification GTPase